MPTDAMTDPTTELALDPAAQRLLFTEARTANTFDPEPVSDETLRAIWELAKWPPTAANINPLRILYLRTAEAKERLGPHMNDNNRGKTVTAPAVAVLAADVEFHEYIPQLFPSRPELKEAFADAERRTASAKYNATLQAGYFLLAIRAAGLAAGPMLGFDAAGVDAEFFADHTWESILVVNIGKPGVDPWFPRLPRLEYEQAVRLA
jgi:3-hydroxypropanoate dehydrogenase